MSDIQIIPVKRPRHKKQFINFPYSLYHNHPIWVPPLIIEQKKNIDTKRNPFYRHADIQLFLAMKHGKVVGRIGAIINHLYNQYHKVNHGFFGFFESTNNQEVANLLIGSVTSWLKAFKLTKIIGPFNPSFFDTIGILVDGFQHSPKVLLPYNYKYYDSLLINAGLNKELDLYGYSIYTGLPSVAKNIKRSEVIINKRLKKTGLSHRSFNLKNIKKEVQIFTKIFNMAWSKNWGFSPLQVYEAEVLAKELKLVLDPRFCVFATHHGKEVGYLLNIPNINIILKKMKGRLFPFGLFKLLYHKSRVNEYRMAVVGVLPEYHKRGVEVLLLHYIYNQYKKYNIIYNEATWIAENNLPAIRTIHKWTNIKNPTTIFRIYQSKL